MQTFLIYPLYTGLLVIVALLLVPRQEIRKLLIFALIFGAVMDALLIKLLSFLVEYINYGPFGFADIPFFPLLAWTAYYILYFYFLPSNKLLRFVYIFTAAFYSLLFSNLLQNLGIFTWYQGRILIPILIYSLWNIIATWGYLKLKRYEGSEEV